MAGSETDGPTVIDAAPHLQGLLDDAWQRPITDIGAAGPDRGIGGKYLILPPGWDGEVPDGYHVCPSRTYRVFVFLRGFFTVEDPDAGLAQINATTIYPLSQSESPPTMTRADGAGVPLDGLPPEGVDYFRRLSDIIGYEPADRQDFYMRGLAAAIGIRPGTAFDPGPVEAETLQAAAAVEDKIAAVTSFTPDDHIRVWPDRRWTSNMVPGPYVTADPEFLTDTYQDVDALLTFFYSAFSNSAAMFLAMPGKGSQYAGGFYDADGDRPVGGRDYTLHIPANVPVANYWSLVLYDAETRCLIDNGADLPSVASNHNVILNADGSADLHFGPNPPEGAPNWIKTALLH